MKKSIKKYRYLIIMLLAGLSLIVVNIFGVFYICVIPESFTIFEFLFGFAITFIFQIGGIAFIGYENKGTPINMLINGLFYFFIIIIVISFVLYIKQQISKIRS